MSRHAKPAWQIGVSARFYTRHPAPRVFWPEDAAYLEQSVAHWIMSGGALPVMIPSPGASTRAR